MQYENKMRKERIHLFAFSIAGYILLLPFDCFRIGNMGSLLKFYAFVPLLILPFTGNIRIIKFNKLSRIMFLYLFWVFLSCFYSINIDVSFASFISLALNVVLAILLGSMYAFNQREKTLLLRSFIISGWIMVFCFLLFGNRDNYAGRLVLEFQEGSSQDANYANGYMLFTFAYHMYEGLNRKKIVHLAVGALLLSIVIMTGSRGALLAFVMCILFVIVWVIRESNHRIRIMLISAAVAIGLYYGFFYMLQQIDPVLAMRFSGEYISEHGATGRNEIWRNLLETFVNTNVFRQMAGWGYGTTRFVNTLSGITTEGMVAHNLYIDNLTSIGVIGVVLQLWMQIECMKILLKSKNAMLICAYGSFIIMCISLSLVNYKPMWCVMMMALIFKNSQYIENRMKVTKNVKKNIYKMDAE